MKKTNKFTKIDGNNEANILFPRPDIYAIFCRTVQLMIVITWVYSLSLIIMTYLIPVISAQLASGMGISYESEMLDILGLWLLPCAFMVLLFLVITIESSKLLYRWLKKNFDKSINKHRLKKQTKKAS